MFPRIREIVDSAGARLRVSIDAHPDGALVVLERPDLSDAPRAILDCYGADLLSGYIISARLAPAASLPREIAGGDFALELHLTPPPCAAILISQGVPGAPPFRIPAPLWDRLYAELCMVSAHGRALGRRSGAPLH